jgi:hypothetical protein
MNVRDHALLCRGTDGPVVEALDALYRAFRCERCGRVVTEWEHEGGADAVPAPRTERPAA